MHIYTTSIHRDVQLYTSKKTTVYIKHVIRKTIIKYVLTFGIEYTYHIYIYNNSSYIYTSNMYDEQQYI